jgi:tetratricopeptide (TPR) repeat protein
MADREPRLGDIAEIANAIQLAAGGDNKGPGRSVFLTGAGCSKSAGIPLVPDMAQQLVLRLAKAKRAPTDALNNADGAYRWLSPNRGIPDCRIGEPPKNGGTDAREIDWPRVYDVLFADHYKTPDHAREIFSDFVDQAEGRINWAHLCLGELVKQKLVSTVITTNFDQLVLAGLVRAGVLPVVCDGIESLTRIRGAPLHPQLIELHGSRHTYRLRNAPDELEALLNDAPTIAAIESLFQELRVFVAVGYAGREKGVMDLLVRAATRFMDKQLFWLVHGSDPARLSNNAQRLLATSRNAALLVGQDADSFFVRLLKELAIGAPESIREPLFLANLHASELAPHDSVDIAEREVIAAEIERHRDEIEAMKRGLSRHRKNRTAAETAMARARELRLAGKLAEALRILQSATKRSKNAMLWRQLAEVALEYGKDCPDRQPLETAVASWRRVVETTDRKSNALVWASAQDSFGYALFCLGEREAGTARLEEAVSAYREALKEWIRKRGPLSWAAIQNNLGNALLRLGERESGTERLEQAVAAYRQAMKEWTRERVPLNWATIQNNLGIALVVLGERGSASTRLEQAVAAYREALKEWTRERVPLDWAMIQNNLCNALLRLGERESGTARLEQAVAACREALKERTR